MTQEPNITNRSNLGLTMALWLATDTYDHDPEDAPKDEIPIVSATELLKPTKALVLGHRVPQDQNNVDLQDLVASRIGQAIHQAIEDAFDPRSRDKFLTKIGTANRVKNCMRVNPSLEQLKKDPSLIPVFLEKRAYRQVTTSNGTVVWISGKFDQVLNGRIEDNKVVGVYKYMKMDDSEHSEYAIQQSIYRWLNPEIITSSVGCVNFIFKDWKRGEVSRIKGYPTEQVMEMPLELMSLEDTEKFIIKKLDDILMNVQQSHEKNMTRCTDEELWRDDPVHKYYKNPETAKKNGRSTKNFDSYADAVAHKQKAGVGVVVTKPGEVRRCNYCAAAPLCTQRLEYQAQ